MNGRVKGKPFAENWSRERLQLGEDFVSGGASSTTGRKRSRLRGGCGEVEIMGMVATARVVAISREATGKEDGGRAA